MIRITPKILKRMDEGDQCHHPDHGTSHYFRLLHRKMWYKEVLPGWLERERPPRHMIKDHNEFLKSIKNRETMKTARFKTKQEFNNEYGPDWKDKQCLPWQPRREVLYGLEWAETGNYLKPYPNLIGHVHGLKVTPEMLTTAPHPYEGKSFKMKVTPEESEAVQKKAFAFNIGWPASKFTVRYTDSPHLYIREWRKLEHGRNIEAWKLTGGIELTPQQFMEGEVPGEENVAAGKGKKTDAYIHEGELYIWSGNKEMPANVNKAWMYNLMSEEDFKAKHTPQLKFKGWEVTVEKRSIKIGCAMFYKETARRFIDRWEKIIGHDVNPEELYGFLRDNQKELGL